MATANLTPEYILALRPTTLVERMRELREKSGLSRESFYTSVESCMQHLGESFDEAMYATYSACTHPRKNHVLSDRYLFAPRR